MITPLISSYVPFNESPLLFCFPFNDLVSLSFKNVFTIAGKDESLITELNKPLLNHEKEFCLGE